MMKQTKLWTLVALFAMTGITGIKAQTNLEGRVYHNANIMAGEFRDGDKRLADAKKNALAKAEKKKGRKLTAEEMKELDEEMKKLEAKFNTIKQGTSIGITIEFKNATEAVMKTKFRMSDEAMKLAGMSWAKRKAMKVAMAAMPSSDSGPYKVKGNLVLFGTDKEGYDTLTISADGKQLYGTYEGRSKNKAPTKFVLKRTK